MSVRTVLNVEDSSDDVFLFQMACKYANVSFRLLTVEDGDEAIAYLKGEREYADREKFPMPDLVLLDLKMPKMSGFDVLEWIRQQPQHKGLPVVVYTASIHGGDIERSHSLGADEFLIKLGGLDYLRELATAIDRVFGANWPSLKPITEFTSRESVYKSRQSWTRPIFPQPQPTHN